MEEKIKYENGHHPNSQAALIHFEGERASEAGKKGALAAAAVKREKRKMRETVNLVMSMPATQDMKEALKKIGVDDDEATLQTMVIAQQAFKAIHDGDTRAARLLAEISGEVGAGKGLDDVVADDISDLNVSTYPTVLIPDNGRDKPKEGFIKPQPGPQTTFLTTKADIAIYGGAAGGGKSYSLLLEGLRHKDVKGFNGVIFRKNNVQITAAGGLWETSHQIYDQVPDAIPKQSPHPHWDFQSGAHIDFEHLEREAELHNWQGTQICFMAFDELTHFTKKMFTYMFSRNRSICGIKPYIRATCNPDAESWVAELISWWIDQDTGYAIEERSGVIRYMTVVNDEIVFGDTADELVEKYGIEDTSLIKSFTFIKSSLDDNQILLQNDPTYKASLMAMSEIDRARLLDGNWKIKASAGMFFRREQIPVDKIYPIIPPDIVRYVRAWDFACTEQTSDNDPDSTSSCLMGKRQNGEYVIIEVTDDKLSTSNVEALLKRKTLEDKARFGFKYSVRIPIDPGEAGKTVAQARVKLLSGVNINPVKVSGSKIDRANPFSAQWQVGNVGIVAGEWNEKFYKQLESFPDGKHDDMVDASSDAFDELANNGNFNLGGLV